MRARAVVLVATCLAAAPMLAQARLTKEDADRFQSKLSRIVEFGNVKTARARQPQSIAVTDIEVNSYLRFQASAQVPVGIVEPILTAVGEGRVSGRALVDLDAVRKQKERGWLDPMGYLSGRLPVTAVGRLTTKQGVGQFTLESAEISGLPVPKGLLQELLTYYSRTPENPAGINMDDKFELPAQIQEIRVGSGTATILQ